MKKLVDQVVTAEEIRRRLGVVDRTLTRWFDAGLPCKRGAGGKHPRVKLWDLVEFVYGKRKEKLEATDGSESPALERYRIAKAEEAERRNAIEMGQLLKRDDVVGQVRAIAQSLRTMAETYSRSHQEQGAEVREMFERTVRQLEKEFGKEAV